MPSSGAVAYSNYLVFISFFVRKDWLVVVTQLDNLCIHLWLFVTDYLICLDDYLFCLDVQIAERGRVQKCARLVDVGVEVEVDVEVEVGVVQLRVGRRSIS